MLNKEEEAKNKLFFVPLFFNTSLLAFPFASPSSNYHYDMKLIPVLNRLG